MDRPDPAEEASHRELMAGLGLYDADWALAKSVELSDVQAGQNRLLLLRQPVRAGSIPRLFPEVEQLDDTGKKNAQNTVRVTLLYAGGVEKEAGLVFLNSNQAYRISGPGWRQFVAESGSREGIASISTRAGVATTANAASSSSRASEGRRRLRIVSDG